MQNKMKMFFQTYGKVGIITYLGTSAVFYSIALIGVKEHVNFKAIGEKLGVQADEKKWEYIESLGPYTAAYVIYKFMAPIKLPLVFGITPLIVKWGRFTIK